MSNFGWRSLVPSATRPDVISPGVRVQLVLVYRSLRSAADNLVSALEGGAGPGWAADVVDNAAALVTAFDLRRPDIAFVGLDVEDPVGTISLLRRIDATVPVLAVGGRDQLRQGAEAISVGARGFIRDDSLDARFPEQGGRPIHAQTGERVAFTLTEREMQVLVGMSNGQSNAEIGRELFLSEGTIKTHARRMFRKVGAKDRAEAVANGFRKGLLR